MKRAIKMPKRVNWQREGLLTEQEKINLQTRRINPKTKSKLFTKIAKRMRAFQEDMQLILECRLGNEWRAKNLITFSDVFELYQVVNRKPAQELYLDRVHIVGRGDKKRYWVKLMDNEEERRYNIIKFYKKLLEPEYSLRKIKRYVNDPEVIRTLIKAVVKKKLPYIEQEALSLAEIGKLV